MIQILSFFASGDNCKRWPLWTGLVHHSWRPCSPRLWWLAVGCCCQLRRDNRSIIINVAWPSRTFKIIPWKNIYEKPDPHHYTTLNLYFRVFLFSKHAQPYTHSIPSAAGPDVQSKGRAWNVALEYARHRSGSGGCRLFVFLLLNFNCFVFLNQEGDSNSPKAQAHVLSYNSSGSIKWLRLLHQRESYWKCINCRETSNAERERECHLNETSSRLLMKLFHLEWTLPAGRASRRRRWPIHELLGSQWKVLGCYSRRARSV